MSNLYPKRETDPARTPTQAVCPCLCDLSFEFDPDQSEEHDTNQRNVPDTSYLHRTPTPRQARIPAAAIHNADGDELRHYRQRGIVLSALDAGRIKARLRHGTAVATHAA